MGSICHVGDRIAASVVHHADDIRSRYFRPEWRERLLELCQPGLPTDVVQLEEDNE
jgi:hypothetical protein